MGAQGYEHLNGENSSPSGIDGSRHPTAQDNATVGDIEHDDSKPTQSKDPSAENVFQVSVKLPHDPYKIEIMVSTQEQVQDLRQTIMETPGAIEYSCFHLEFAARKINDYIELSELEGLVADSVFTLVEDPYTEREARLHLLRTREIVGVNTEKPDEPYGIAAGATLHDEVCSSVGSDNGNTPTGTTQPTSENKLSGFSFDSLPNPKTIVPVAQRPKPRTIKSLTVSPWNPPPSYLRQAGHLMYLQLTTNEGEQLQITSHIRGFFVNKSSNSKFDPYPRPPPKHAYAHSLLSLIMAMSPSFESTLARLHQETNSRDPLVNFQVTNAVPTSPWLVSQNARSLAGHSPDLARTQESYVMSGPDGIETLRDWNEEIQSTRELPRETVQERVFRERLIAKTYAEFTDAAVKGALLVARGEVAPLNPTESADAQIFVYNNVFYSFGADGVGTFTSDGGDEAARVAVAKDVAGVKAVNQLDIKGLSTAGTIIIDYLGRRIVAQSIVPGIFKQREPDEHQVDYGGVEGRDIIADNPAFVPTFSQASKLLKVKPHAVWDKDGKRYDLEASVETKGLLGTDGRKYILDLYRLTPVDISWLEEKFVNSEEGGAPSHPYPHRMTTLRPELVDSYWRLKMSDYVKQQLKQKDPAVQSKEPEPETSTQIVKESQGQAEDQNSGTVADLATTSSDKNMSEKTAEKPDGDPANQSRVDISAFSLALNPDVFCGQKPQSDSEKAEMIADEEQVRAVCSHLHDTIFPELIRDLREAEVGFPMDGLSLTGLLHKRGINVRYLGRLARLAGSDARGNALKNLAEQEMIARGFKHEAFRYLKGLPSVLVTSCVSHLLNCFLGRHLNPSPKAAVDAELAAFYPDANLGFGKVDPDSLAEGIRQQARRRFRYELPEPLLPLNHHLQMLRSICLKFGIQLAARDYHFSAIDSPSESQPPPNPSDLGTVSKENGQASTNGASKKKKKGTSRSGTAPSTTPNLEISTTFTPEDIVNLVPVVKESAPKSILAEEAFEAGKISMMQNQKEIGQELLLESLTLHEQIYGVLHPEVARVYHQLAMLYFQLDEKPAAIELAHKAVIISERTLGLDSSETVLSYLNLALFEHGNRNTVTAVACVRHALEIWNVIYGQSHPDLVTTLNNAAVMLQHLQKFTQSREWFEQSLQLSQEMSGTTSVSTATVLFQLAQALVLDGDHKGAVQRMREAYSIFLSKLGPEDGNTRESEKWLEQLTQNAVSMAKHAKDVQARRIRRVLLNHRSARLGGEVQPRIHQGQGHSMHGSDAQNPAVLDSRNIDELLRYIEGGGDITKSPPSKKRSGKRNPRRKGGPPVDTIA